MSLMKRGLLPFFYNLLLRPLETEHAYNTRSNSLRHPRLTSEVERRAVIHQIILLNESLPSDFNLNDPIHIMFRKYKKYLLITQ